MPERVLYTPLQLFPYHLADYVCRVLRVSPHRYYCDLLYTVMREEKSYDQIPNFAVRHAAGRPGTRAWLQQHVQASGGLLLVCHTQSEQPPHWSRAPGC